MMNLSEIFYRKHSHWEQNKQYLKSGTDLNLLPGQVIYVEGYFDNKINKFISKNYNKIFSRLKESKLSADFVYLPVIANQFQDSQTSLFYFLNYYFPNIDTGKNPQNTFTVLKTDFISHLLFSAFDHKDHINPGFFRYIGKDKNDSYEYEYFRFDVSNRYSISKQIDYYIGRISHKEGYDAQTNVDEEVIYFDDKFKEDESYIELQEEAPFPIDFFEKKAAGIHLFSKKANAWSKSLFDEEDELVTDNTFTLNAEEKISKNEHSCKEYELISQMRTDIQNLKALGFYELLIKEIGSILFDSETSKIFQPSRIVINDNFKIYLPDFNNMEIGMTPLPKSLFILFLRHPQGINLKSLIDYKKELLEIYKLLSYRETYFNIVESVDRICNPFEGSINEKLSRIKEAFLKRMSMDTAKYYIVAGDRGMKKKIKIDRSLIELPKVLEEINLTKVLD
ncbi:MAG: hypothetical protein LBJ72_05075 [Dysgonamonadaceae bacterium]|jgi:hypothetical protein|nr:hypothetical protein [Dysgonamonadaceae bacterium]